jgi:hypothetical protein
MDNTNFAQKNKFYIKDDPSKNVPGHYKLKEEKSAAISSNILLLKPEMNTKSKTQMVLNRCFKPCDYNLPYSKINFNYDNPYHNNIDIINEKAMVFSGAGRGFGNLTISNEIRHGDASRNNTKDYKEKQEGLQTFDYKFNYLDKNFQDPRHIVMSIPRGGVQTRKQSQLNVNNMRSFQTENIATTVDFKY